MCPEWVEAGGGGDDGIALPGIWHITVVAVVSDTL